MFSAQCRIACLLGLGFFLLLYTAVENLQSCSSLERIPVGKRQAVCSECDWFRQTSLYFFVTLYYISLHLYISGPPFLVDNNQNSVLHETYFGSWPTWALVSASSIFWQVFIFLCFLAPLKLCCLKHICWSLHVLFPFQIRVTLVFPGTSSMLRVVWNHQLAQVLRELIPESGDS